LDRLKIVATPSTVMKTLGTDGVLTGRRVFPRGISHRHAVC
jgi:hypothetical protein